MTRTTFFNVVRQCLRQRTSPKGFEEILSLTSKEEPATGVLIVASLLRAGIDYCYTNDPLLSSYVKVMLVSRRATLDDCLYASIRIWQKGNIARKVHENLHPVLCQFIADLVLIINETFSSIAAVHASIILCARWLRSICDLVAADTKSTHGDDLTLLAHAICPLLVTLISVITGKSSLLPADSRQSRSMRVAVQAAIQASASKFPLISVQLSAEASVLFLSGHPTSGVQEPNLRNSHETSQEVEQTLIETPINPSRTATYVLLLTLLSENMTIEDNALCSYLAIRHASNPTAMFNDILYAAFDLLTKSPRRGVATFNTQCCIFIYNKLPNVLADISLLSELIQPQQELLQFWSELSSLQTSEALAIARQFMRICNLHNLVASEQLENILGDTITLPISKGLASGQALFNQVMANASRGTRLVDELLKNDGNVAAFAHAIKDVVQEWCQKKATHHLKDLCNKIVRQPSLISSLAMFVKPSSLLAPLCRLLDEWSWDDIHGESQPVYEEFGSVLLLVVTVKHILGLSDEELGLCSRTGFLAQYLSLGHSEKSQLSSEEHTRLGDWMHNLYESEGISDEVTSRCHARDFHLIVPTLLHQSLAAFQAGNLTQERLEGGLDYLLEPFLLSSLLLAFRWLSQAIVKDPHTAGVAIKRLARAPENPDTRELHSTIMGIMKSTFDKSLIGRSSNVQHAEISTIFEQITTLDPTIAQPFPDPTENVSRQKDSIEQMLQALTNLVTGASFEFDPALVRTATQARGLNQVVKTLVRNLAQSNSSNHFQLLLDTMATIFASNGCQKCPLADALHLLYARLNVPLSGGMLPILQAMVHLRRRVDSYVEALKFQPDQAKPASTDADLQLIDVNLDQTTQDTLPSKPEEPVPPVAVTDESLNEMADEVMNLEPTNDFALEEDNTMPDWNNEYRMDDDLDFDKFFGN